MLSSAKNRWVSLGPLLHIEKPLMSFALAAFLIKPCSPSVHNKKRNGEAY